TVNKINSGSALVTTTNEAFAEVTTVTDKVGQLVGEISSASQEQAEGIEQVNTALVEMDSTIQQNAATSEESAGASEEMNAQAVTMMASVEELVAMVQGSKMTKINRPSSKNVLGEKKKLGHPGMEVSPDQLISFNNKNRGIE
ncbi:MAG: hypothetical protein KAR45_22760, partial [Desulfobacteraceae bacterium]|nr:hypothetical protein [Desulfobacteraceae bacterium]